MGTAYLMYHELEIPGQALCRAEPGYRRYVVDLDTFRAHLESLRAKQLRGCSVSAALRDGEPEQVVMTFDDGCATDRAFAAPLLREFDFAATFYVVAGFVGQPGYLSESGVRELRDLGMEIGCHSMTHAYLSDLDPVALRREVVDAKEKLEQILGARVDHYSCPGGRWSPQAAVMARDAGFQSMATSRAGVNTTRTDPFQLRRLAITRGLDRATFADLCQGRGLWKRQLAESVLGAAKNVLGNRRYEQVRTLLMGKKATL